MLDTETKAGLTTGMGIPVGESIGGINPFTTGILRTLANSGLKGEIDQVVRALPLRMYAKRADMTYVACSNMFAADFGLAPEHMIGRTNHELFGENYTAPCHDEEAKVLATGLTRVTEQPYAFRESTIWIRATRAPVFDVDGRVAGMVATLLDVSGERSARRQRGDAVAGLMQLWVYSREAVLVVCAASATVIDVNPAVQILAGRSREALLGQPLAGLFATDDHARAREGFQNALGAPATIGGLRLIRGDGGQVAVSLASSDVFENDGRAHVLLFARRES